MKNMKHINIYEFLKSHRASVAVVGLGYVGLPLALELSKHFNVVGYDSCSDTIDSISDILPPPDHIGESGHINEGNLAVVKTTEGIADASFYIIAVGTPVDSNHNPDINHLLSATATVGRLLKPGDYVVYESTVFPGCTEEECVPLLEKISGLKCGHDFKVGYSPERINPGDASHVFANTPKIISGCDDEAAAEIARVYGSAISARLHVAHSIRSAEAAKLLENIQRCVNIALINEMSKTFAKMGIDTNEVIKLAASKWNFTEYSPGLVGGHCIPVDPYYLIAEASRAGIDMPLTRMGCAVNESMPDYVADSVATRIRQTGHDGRRPRVLVLGIAYKRNSDDIRNSGVVEMIARLLSHGIECDVVDEMADSEAVKRMYGIELLPEPSGVYDAVIVAVDHDCYANLDEKWFESVSVGADTLLADLCGTFRGKVSNLKYWTL